MSLHTEIGSRCNILIAIGPVCHLDLDRPKNQPGLAFYAVAVADLAERIDLILLDHMHCRCTIAFVGGEEARREAQAYHVAWIEDSPSVNDALIIFWREMVPAWGSR